MRAVRAKWVFPKWTRWGLVTTKAGKPHDRGTRYGASAGAGDTGESFGREAGRSVVAGQPPAARRSLLLGAAGPVSSRRARQLWHVGASRIFVHSWIQRMARPRHFAGRVPPPK